MIYKVAKRGFDIVASLAGIIILLPLLLPILLALRLTGEGHVFYFQTRIGFRNVPFEMWKFATMLKDSPNMKGGMITVRGDPRVTVMGGFLRKTKINELPQIVNVLMGNMSVVGPRPLAEQTFSAYSSDIQDVVYRCKPGITGVGSLIFRDEERLISSSGLDPNDFYKTHIAPHKGELELWYGENASATVDLLIIFLTSWVIIFAESRLPYKLLKGLPEMPEDLKSIK